MQPQPPLKKPPHVYSKLSISIDRTDILDPVAQKLIKFNCKLACSYRYIDIRVMTSYLSVKVN